MTTEDSGDKTRMHVTLTAGELVLHYRIINKIGAGGMGEVFLAEDTKLKRKVALKFLPTNLASNDEIKTRFLREAQAVANLGLYLADLNYCIAYQQPDAAKKYFDVPPVTSFNLLSIPSPF